MARGHEDWGLNTGRYSGYVTDLSEIPARLGSPAVWLRTGSVIFMETFNNTWRTFQDFTASPNKGLYIDTLNQFSGNGCLKLDGKGTSLVTAKALKGLPFIQLGCQGLEVLAYSENDFQQLILILDYYRSGQVDSFSLRLDYAVDTLSFTNSTPATQTIDNTLDLESTRPYYNYLKMVVDLDNFEWKYVWLNETKYDLSGEASNNGVSSADAPRIELTISTSGTASGDDYIYIDNVIYTIDEPSGV